MFKQRNFLILAIVFITFISIYASDFDLADRLPVDEDILIGSLENGLTYYIKKNSEPENIAEFRLALKVGSVFEEDDQRGVAHFVEHLAFSGTEHFPTDSLRTYLNSLGFGFLGGLNAMTSIEFTIYQLSARANEPEQLDNAVLILSDWAGRVTFEEEKIDKERGIILEEMRGGRGARERMSNELFKAVFAGSRYVERSPIGTQDSIENVLPERIRDFYNDWYQLENMAVIAVGDFEPSDIEDLIQKHFNSLPKRENPKPAPDFTIPTHAETRFSFYTDPEATRTSLSIYIKHPSTDTNTIEDMRNNIIESLLSDMLSNRFTEISRQPDPPFVSAYGGIGGMLNPISAFILNATVDENQIMEGFTSLITELERALQQGFHNSELTRAKASLFSRYQRSYLERDKVPSNRQIWNYTFAFLQDITPLDDEYDFELSSYLLETITMDDIMLTLNNYVTEENRVILINTPEVIGVELPSEESILALFDTAKNSELEIFPETLLEEPLLAQIPKRVKAGKPKHDKNIDLYTWKLKNGATVYLKSTDFRNNEIVFNAWRSGGHSLADDEILNSARTAPAIMGESGIGPFDNTMLDIFLDDKDVRLRGRISNLGEGFSGSSSPGDFETFMQLLYQNFMSPRFDDNAFITWKNNTEINLRNLANSPNNTFGEAMVSLLYNDHPRMKQMQVEDLELVDHQVAFDFYKSRLSSANDFNFVFVGNITPAELQKYIELYIATLPKTKVNTTPIDRGVRYNQQTERKAVYHGQDDRTMVRVIFPYGEFQYSSKESILFSAINSILFEMLTDNVREKMSGVYVIQPYHDTDFLPDANVNWNIYFGCDPNRIDEIIEETYNQLNIVINNEFEDKYLQTFKETHRRQREIQERTNNYWLSQIISYLQNDMPFEEILNLKDMADNITREEIAEGTRKYYNFEHVLTVILYPELIIDN